MDFSLALDATAQYQGLRETVMCNSEHGLVRPVEIVDVSRVIPRDPAAHWIESGRPILVVYGSDPHLRKWYAVLRQPLDGGGSTEIGFSGVGQPLSEKVERTVSREVGLTLAQVAELYLACVPDRLKRSVRDSGVAV